MFLVAITVLIVLMAGAIAVDLSAMASRGQSLQNAADSAALAGVQAYRESMGERTEANDADKAAAIAAINALLAQNGITGVTPIVEFPDSANDTEVRVTLSDSAGTLLGGISGSDGNVNRQATARFERCEDGCIKEVEIPPPFQGVNTAGDGDGYKPIPVGDRLYSINHQSGAGRGTHQITCVQRDEQHCWETPGILAYPNGYVPYVTPEMPHAAVAGTRIYWASSTSSGHYLFCFETLTSTPCPTPYLLSSARQNTNLPKRLIHRGGATIEEDGLIYTFTDDHMVHCIVPGTSMAPCSGYPKLSSIGQAPHNFPPNTAEDKNHGSSLDRIADDPSGRIYSTMHIDNTPNAVDCSSDYSSGNVEEPRGSVVLLNAYSGQYLSVAYNLSGVTDSTDPTDPAAQWEILNSNGRTLFRSVYARENGYTRYLALDVYNPNEELYLTRDWVYGRHFNIDYYGATSRIEAYYYTNGFRQYVREDGVESGGTIDYTFTGGAYDAPQADWIIRPWQCEDPNYNPNPGGPDALPYETGTYINCFDTVQGSACSGFEPSKLHEDWDSFSGRLFFYRDSGGNMISVCSTGFSRHFWSTSNINNYLEISCVDPYSGADDAAYEGQMETFRQDLASFTNGNWGTWGDPHYNKHTNRLFYPSHRQESAVICFDFDYGSCGATQHTSGLGATQDYGFFSEGNCVFGLGHEAIFWAFSAEDPGEKCSGSSAVTTISPCDCGGNYFWGTLSFDVTIEQFEEFTVVLEDLDGNQVYPPGSGDPANPAPAHSIITDGDVINLNFIPITDPDQELVVVVEVEAKPGIDPWAEGSAGQSFTIEIERTPRLVE